MNVIDLRSDTVTHPTPAMRQAMANATVGDDVYGEDPTINQLEADAANVFGKEAGLFVASGTQGNLVSLLSHCQRGDEIIVGKQAHIFRYEAGGMAVLGGISPNTIDVQTNGELPLDEIRTSIREDDPHMPITRLICLENTQGTMGGLPITKSYINQVADIAQEHKLKLHIDGARIFNAATALNTPVHVLAENIDSLTFCLSKGLCAPAGSVVVGDAKFIERARRARKLVGGAMRQAGILAAAGLIALHEQSKRLQKDHDTARYLAESLSEVPHIEVLSNHTNFTYFNLLPSAPLSPQALEEQMAQRDILISPYPGYERKFRCVTHYWVHQHHIDAVVSSMRELLT